MKKDNPYGYCPICGSPGRYRERRPNGNDKCHNGHTYPSRSATPTADMQKQETIDYDLKKLLPLAARACGLQLVYPFGEKTGFVRWNGPRDYRDISDEDGALKLWLPHEYPGDGAEMEDKLRISVEWRTADVVAEHWKHFEVFARAVEVYADHPDVGTARRWASLRVAAEIGRSME
jgi:hypothetical protein